MHFRTHAKPESVGQAGRWQSPYHDTMVDHDRTVGALLNKLDDLGIAESTIVIYSTDNGPHQNTWPDGGTTPFRSEKNTNWEGAFRIPELIRWPGRGPAGVVSNGIVQHHDWLPTLLAAAGEPDIVDKLKAGHEAGGVTYKVHVDGYNLLPYLTGDEEASPRQGFVYFSDDGDVLALRYDNWKVVFMEQRVQGTLLLWAEPFVALRVPKLYNLRTDPFERADVTSNTYYDWLLENGYIALAATAILTQFLATFRGLPAAPAGGDLHDRPGGREARGGARVGALGAAAGTLASWNDTPTRQAIVDFVEAAARDVPPEERVATFDNDSTLWCEKPMPIQLDFILRRLAEMAAADPKQQGEQPWQAAYERDVTWLGAAVEKHYQGDDGDVKLLVAVPQAFAGLTVGEYDARVTEFFRDGKTRTPARVATPR